MLWAIRAATITAIAIPAVSIVLETFGRVAAALSAAGMN